MKKRLPIFVYLLLFLGFLAFSKELLSATDPARLLVHLISYLSEDYSNTVSSGKIINPSEYQEQVEFSDLALKTYQEIEKKPSSKELEIKLKKLNSLIHQQADPLEVTPLAKEIKNSVTEIYQLKTTPDLWPSLAKGQKIYSENCTTCHGAQGNGEGPIANQLNPKPANFLNTERMSRLSPFQIFNTIRLGVPNTAMAGFQNFSDQEVWDLSFYLLSLRYPSTPKNGLIQKTELDSILQKIPLSEISSSSDEELRKKIDGTDEEKDKILKTIRLNSNQNPPENPLSITKTHLNLSLKAYQENQFSVAEQEAVIAYLKGVEPVEPILRVKNSSLVSELESKMISLRSLIAKRVSVEQIQDKIQEIEKVIAQAELILNEKNASAWFLFFMASSILLREGFEAVLIIIAILGVVRASKNKAGERSVHAGWGAAILLGVLAWFFSGWIIQMSGAARELMEGITSLFAVVVLIYVGLWLHHKTEIGRWTAFIDGKVKSALDSKNLWGLSLIAFMAVFREAFETVLFLRSLALEGGANSSTPLLAGVLSSFIFVFILAFALLKLSARIPLKRIFSVSSLLIVFLAIILIGKGIKSLQETGLISITALSIPIRVDLLGLYPTVETFASQALAFLLIAVLWNWSRRVPVKTADLPT